MNQLFKKKYIEKKQRSSQQAKQASFDRFK